MEPTLITNLISYVGLPVLIFFARILDVTLGTLRIIFISRGKKFVAPVLGFIETFIWIVAVSQIVRNINGDMWAYVAYAAGFASGTTIGLLIEDKLALGTLIVRTILPEKPLPMVDRRSQAGYGVTMVQGEGIHGPVTLLYTIIKRKKLLEVVSIIHNFYPHAFLSIEELRSTQEGVFPKDTAIHKGIRGFQTK